jgi:hypothetical protein
MRGLRQKRSLERHVLRRRERILSSNVSLRLKRGVWRETDLRW